MIEYKEPYYTKNDGVYMYHSGIHHDTIGTSIAIAFSQYENGDTVLHKHGSPKFVNKWAETTRKKLLSVGDRVADEMAEEIRVIESNALPVEDLNKMITTTGYVKYFLKNNGFC